MEEFLGFDFSREIMRCMLADYMAEEYTTFRIIRHPNLVSVNGIPDLRSSGREPPLTPHSCGHSTSLSDCRKEVCTIVYNVLKGA